MPEQNQSLIEAAFQETGTQLDRIIAALKRERGGSQFLPTEDPLLLQIYSNGEPTMVIPMSEIGYGFYKLTHEYQSMTGLDNFSYNNEEFSLIYREQEWYGYSNKIELSKFGPNRSTGPQPIGMIDPTTLEISDIENADVDAALGAHFTVRWIDPTAATP